MRKAIAVLWLGSASLLASVAEAQSPVPAPWRPADIGAVGTPGTAYQGPTGDFYANGAGSDIWGTADSFFYVYQPIRDGSISATVGAQNNSHGYAKAGVMIRQSLDPGSPEVILDVKPDGGIEFMTRSSQGGETTFIDGSWVPATATSDNRVTFASRSGVSDRQRRLGASIAPFGGGGRQCSTVGSTSFASGRR